MLVNYLLDNEKEFENGIFGYLIFKSLDGRQQLKEISKK
jgi:hypothetical protein